MSRTQTMKPNWMKAEKKLNEETSVASPSDKGEATTTETSKGHSMKLKSGGYWRRSEKKLNEETFGTSSSSNKDHIFYDKKDSFFDSISYGVGATTEKYGCKSEKELNEQTFDGVGDATSNYYYDKNKSFFDSISSSCEYEKTKRNTRGRGGYSMRSRMKLNEETFGASTDDFLKKKDLFDKTSESTKEKVRFNGQSMNADGDGNAEKKIHNEMKEFTNRYSLYNKYSRATFQK